MRELKFRGQTRRKGEKVWLNGKPVDSNWVFGGVFPGQGDFSIIYSSNPVEKHTVYTDTIGQFTGFRDNRRTEEYPDGKEIYEGDIVSFEDGYQTDTGHSEQWCIGEVVWDKETASFQVTDRLSAESYEVLENCKVIGNIYDNPELLKEIRE